MSIAISNYIPQRPPMVMIDELLRADETTAESAFVVRPDNIFVESGKLTEPALVENIAQTAAAMVGYQCAIQHKPVPLGYIAAIKNLTFGNLPAVTSALKTTVTVVNKVMDVTIVEGKVEQDGRLLCSCEMRILVKENRG